ncbi:MAG: L-seryl-tRNA(Ser) seleniumtransferase [Thermomicrobiales bacterium]|nr:L-seryl-tRNA(Ser) seleniumtransferase [Thermomicrobiales bacterium]
MADESDPPARSVDDGPNPFAALPSVSSLLQLARDGGTRFTDATLTPLLQRILAEARVDIATGVPLSRGEIERRAIDEIVALRRARLTPILNATGVVIHTNLGRAPVSVEAAEAMAAVAAGYVPLEIEPDSGLRGGRMREISTLMRLLTGAEETLVVNNNAAAVLLTLSALAFGKSVIVSRGEAVEIGGGFRIPDVLRQSGATLVEVGTTNRTYARDYAGAIDGATGALLKVHPSNFAITGFTASASVTELAGIARADGIPVVEDLGSGALVDTQRFGLRPEPTIGASLAAGAAIVTASGDKLLGGPQAGIIAGSRDWVKRIEAHPLARAVRADKTCLAGLAVTLRHYAAGEEASKIPVWRMISTESRTIRDRAEALVERLSQVAVEAQVAEVESTVGGGSLPGQTMPSFAVSIASDRLGQDELARRLRTGEPSVFPRIADGRVLLDLRTVLPEDDARLTAAIVNAVSRPA